jgi:RNA polymerase sigma factor (sigma-70 family)
MTRRQTAQVLAHLGLVRPSATILGGRLQNRGADDLVSAGHLGLVQAVRDFDTRRFRPGDLRKFLGWKIWCAQLDAVRGRDLMTGTYRAWQRGTLARKPILLTLHSGDPVEDQDEPGREMHDARLISPWPDPEALAIAADEARAGRRRLRGWLARLSHRDRLLLIARYGHGRRLIAIGREHGIGESRVSHLAERALRAVRAAAA